MSRELLQALNADLARAVAGGRRGLVQIQNGRHSGGAGTIWHEDGLIVTNAHVVRQDAPRVTLPDGQTLPARVLGWDRQRDLAALAVRAHGLPAMTLGDSRELEPGDWVLALGHPWGITGAATGGAVIALGPSPEIAYPGDLIQVGLHLRPGHSGGALVDGTGRMVGVNCMIAGPDVGLAIPVHAVHRFLKTAL